MLKELLLGQHSRSMWEPNVRPLAFVYSHRFRIGDTPADAEFDVDIPRRVGIWLEITAENSYLSYEQRPAAVSVVFTCAFQQSSDQAVGSLPADRLPRACHGQVIATDCRLPSNVAVVVDVNFYKVADLLQTGEGTFAVFGAVLAKQAFSHVLNEGAGLEWGRMAAIASDLEHPLN